MKKRANVLIVDLDNTLFDWVEGWYVGFMPVYNALKNKIDLPEDQLLEEIKALHRQKRTSEYTFLIDELPSVVERYHKGRIREVFKDAILESKQARDKALKLYPTVLRTLWEIKKRGTLIVAYTESLSFYSGYRLKKFGLDGVIDYLYSPQDHDLPQGVSLDRVRNASDEFYELQITQVRHTPAGEIKPNRKLLLDIIKDVGSVPENCVYIGDSLFKDVAMAQDAKVADVWAEYGVSQHKDEYKILRQVSHWTDADIEREKATSKRNVQPSIAISQFSDLLSHFEFVAFKPKSLDEERLKIVVDIWKKCVEVQQHFNDIEMRIRNFALTVVGALVAAIGFTYQQRLFTEIGGMQVPLSVALVVFALIIWCGFFFMDRFWYHNMLKGAVIHAGEIEREYEHIFPEMGLGRSISQASPLKIFGFKISSNRKIVVFYLAGAAALIGLLFALLFAKPLPVPRVDWLSPSLIAPQK